MNYESGALRADQPGTDIGGDARWDATETSPPSAASARWKIALAVVLGIAVLAVAWALFAGGDAKGGAATGEDKAEQAPSVTVISPGTTLVENVISSTGTLAARREMPVGIAGEGGQVVRVLVEPGQWVRAGQVLAIIERSVQNQQAAQLEAQIRVAQADARLAQAELDRAQALVGRGFISTADLERRTATRDSATARVRVAEAQLAEARARTRRLDIRAPDAGLVLTRSVEPGQVVGAGSGILFRIARGGEMELLARVGEADLAAMRVGTRASVTPVGSVRSFTGQVWQVAPVIDAQSRQGTARIALPYASELRPGGFATASIISGAVQAPLLPESAVLDDEAGNYVFTVGPDKKAKRVAVTIGNINERGVPILSGLTGNERIVLNAGGFLNPGDSVIPVAQRSR